MRFAYSTAFVLLLALAKAAVVEDQDKRLGRQFPGIPGLSIFNVYRFENGPCEVSATLSGTCYTPQECARLGGTDSGVVCASPVGTCCVFNLACGQTSSQNCTYLERTAATPTAEALNPCMYTICPATNDICRIRFDFINFNIAGPFAGTLAGSDGGAIGDCVDDTFSVTSPGNRGSPVICGVNTGQHLYVDASNQCHKATFALGTVTNKAWNIKVTQYACGDEANGGPDGCLQYFRNPEGEGTINSFNFQTPAGGTQPTHLSNQDYTICVRQAAGQCRICYEAATFGLSLSPAAIAQSAVDSDCSTDYISIAGGTVDGTTDTANRFCGRFLSAPSGGTVNAKVCTSRRPFRINVRTDADEATVAGGDATTSETEPAPNTLGTLGFSLTYTQDNTMC